MKSYTCELKIYDLLINFFRKKSHNEIKPWVGNDELYNFFSKSSELVKLYSACDLLVAPSIYETFGQVVLEAASCNLPVVAFNNTGIVDIIRHKKTGYLAKFIDIEDFARGIDWCLNNFKNQRINSKIRSYVRKRFDIDSIVEKYESVYSKILKQNERKIKNI